MSDFVLGTAQFGQKYGITNKSKKFNDVKNLELIIEKCFENNIRSIDTAKSYGKSEEMLGKIDLVKKFKVNTKLVLDVHNENVNSTIRRNIENSLSKLQIEKINILFMHNQISDKNFLDKILKVIDELKSENLLSHFGMSVYDLNEILDIDQVEAYQVPANYLDRRFFNLFNSNNDRVFQARSIFLQGILLANYQDLPQEFKESVILKKYHRNFRTLEQKIFHCFSVLDNSQADEILFGVSNIQELEQILEIVNKKDEFIEISDNYEYEENILDPRKWD